MGKRTRFARARKAAGYTQDRLAAELAVDRSTVFRWEAGRSEPLPYLRATLARLLGINHSELEALLREPGGVEGNRALLQEEHLADVGLVGPGRNDLHGDVRPLATQGAEPQPTFAQVTRTPTFGEGGVMPRRTVHPELLHQYETLTSTYRQLDYQAGSGAVYNETVAQLGRMLTLADNVPSSLYRRFVLALGDSAQLAAWLAIDHQDYGAARHYTALALSSAQEGADPTLHAYVLGIMSYIHLHAGRGPDAVRLLEAALRLAETPRLGVNQAVYSWLCEAMGEAQALAGEYREGAASLAKAERLFDAVAIDDVPAWLGFFNSAEHVTRLKGRCLVKLGDGSSAVRTLEQAVADLPTHYVRERSGTLIDLAAAHLMPLASGSSAADPEAAATTALEAWELAVETGSGRNQRRIRELLPQFAPFAHHLATQALQGAVR